MRYLTHLNRKETCQVTPLSDWLISQARLGASGSGLPASVTPYGSLSVQHVLRSVKKNMVLTD